MSRGKLYLIFGSGHGNPPMTAFLTTPSEIFTLELETTVSSLTGLQVHVKLIGVPLTFPNTL